MHDHNPFFVMKTRFYKKKLVGFEAFSLNQPSFKEFEKPFENRKFQMSSNSLGY